MSRFEDIIQQKANDHEARVPNDVWDNISRKKDKRRYGLFWWTAAALLLGLLIVGYYNYRTTGVEKVGEVSKVEKGEKVEGVNGVDKVNEIHKVGEDDKVVGVDNVNEVDKADVVNKVNKIDKTALDNNKTKTGSNPVVTNNVEEKPRQPANGINKKNSNKNITTKDTKEKDNGISTAKTRIVKKDNARSRIKIESAETGALTGTEKKDIPATVSKETGNNYDQENIVNNDKKETGNDINKETLPPPVVKKDLAVDSTQKKMIATAPIENKKQPAAKKQPGKQSWFIDVAVTPVFPIQQYDHSATFNRTLFFTNSKSEFSGTITNTRIDPSIAFSLAARRSFNKKLSIGLGIQYLQLKEHISIEGKQINTVYKYVDWLIDNIDGPTLVRDSIGITMEGKKNIDATNGYRFLSLPVYIQYNFLQKHSLSLGLVAGINVNMMSSYRNEINRNAKAPLVNTSQTNGNTNVGFSLFTGLRIGKMLDKRFELYALPSFSYSPAEQHIKNNVIDKKIHKAGVSIGISYKLK